MSSTDQSYVEISNQFIVMAVDIFMDWVRSRLPMSTHTDKFSPMPSLSVFVGALLALSVFIIRPRFLLVHENKTDVSGDSHAVNDHEALEQIILMLDQVKLDEGIRDETVRRAIA